MLLGSYKQVVDGVTFEPHKFQGHGWLYSKDISNPKEVESLIKSGAFELNDQKKNSRPVILRKPPANNRKRGCCGRR